MRVFSILTSCYSYRGVERRRSPGIIITFTAVHRRRLNAAFGLNWRRAPAHTAVRYILQGLDPAAVEGIFRHHAALLQAAHAKSGQDSTLLDGKTLRGSVEPRGSPDFDKFRNPAAAQMLSAFATDTALVLAHIDIADASNEIPAAQTLLAELGVADGTVVTLDALHCEKRFRSRSSGQQRPDRRRQGQPTDPAPAGPGHRRDNGTARVRPQPRQHVILGEDRSRICTTLGVFARQRSFAFDILRASRTNTLSQDRYRAGLAGITKLLRMLAVP